MVAGRRGWQSLEKNLLLPLSYYLILPLSCCQCWSSLQAHCSWRWMEAKRKASPPTVLLEGVALFTTFRVSHHWLLDPSCYSPGNKCEVWASPSSFFFFPPKVLAHPASTWKMKPSDFCPYWALWPRPKIIVCARVTSILRMPRKVGLSSGSLLLPTLQDKCVRFH